MTGATTVAARTAGAALAALGSFAWLLSMLGGTVQSPTVWAVVGVGVGVFLVANALRLAKGPARLSPRARRIVGGLLAGSLVLGVVMGIVGGPGPGVFVAGSLVGIVLWVASSMVVAASDQAS